MTDNKNYVKVRRVMVRVNERVDVYSEFRMNARKIQRAFSSICQHIRRYIMRVKPVHTETNISPNVYEVM